jgi:glycine cleavage system H protein
MTSNTIPQDRLHTASHEWLQTLENGEYAIGISDAGQSMLGDIVFCGEAAIGKPLKAGDVCAIVESVKAASDVHMPIDGTVLAFNSALEADPAILNTQAYGTWIIKITASSTADLSALMSPTAYEKQL